MIIQNAIMITEDWPNYSFLVSSHVHDFKTHTFKDGTQVSVDGGTDYIRRCFPYNRAGYGTKWMEYCLDDKEPFSTIKQKLLWGTRGKDGKQPLKFVNLLDCENDHLYNILTTQKLNPIHKEVINTILFDDRNYIPPFKGTRKKIISQLKPFIHKATRPKYHFINPTLCNANLNDQDAHKLSRISWTNVTCPECLKRRKHNDF